MKLDQITDGKLRNGTFDSLQSNVEIIDFTDFDKVFYADKKLSEVDDMEIEEVLHFADVNYEMIFDKENGNTYCYDTIGGKYVYNKLLGSKPLKLEEFNKRLQNDIDFSKKINLQVISLDNDILNSLTDEDKSKLTKDLIVKRDVVNINLYDIESYKFYFNKLFTDRFEEVDAKSKSLNSTKSKIFLSLIFKDEIEQDNEIRNGNFSILNNGNIDNKLFEFLKLTHNKIQLSDRFVVVLDTNDGFYLYDEKNLVKLDDYKNALKNDLCDELNQSLISIELNEVEYKQLFMKFADTALYSNCKKFYATLHNVKDSNSEDRINIFDENFKQISPNNYHLSKKDLFINEIQTRLSNKYKLENNTSIDKYVLNSLIDRYSEKNDNQKSKNNVKNKF
ncbi:hypothetical protein L7E35_004669 [Vibrio parahaemolyticus]|nr:hypothetical protein [Vibrio parahaemolyticus]EIV1599723.1 hypothetical protein [Vibrio parahaemolyticus]